MWWLLASLLLSRPVPLEMPRAESFLVKESGRYRLEDRYQAVDLWLSRSVLGCWLDDEDRVLTVSRIETEPPTGERLYTRVDYGREVRPLGRREVARRHRAMAALAPVPLADEGERPHQLPRGYQEVLYWQGTNTSVILCEFVPRHSTMRYFATWTLLPEDDPEELTSRFEHEFLGEDFAELFPYPSWRDFAELDEAEALRADAHDSVTNSAGWHWTDADDYVVLDDLSGSRALVTAITNELPQLKADFVRAWPTPLESTNVLGVVRVFADREEFRSAADESARWSAAYWSPSRREIVAYLPVSGMDGLIRTFRHEAFHQYLSYATAMIPVSPWLNEGYAQYFEDPESADWDLPFAPEDAGEALEALFAMDYPEFYSGSDDEVRIKYRLARSVAVFIERGMREIRNDPFRDFKREYLEKLVSGQNMLLATEKAFGNVDRRNRFIYEWKRFWKDMSAD